MRLVNETPFAVGYLAGRIGHPAHSLTVAVKGTFRLMPGAPAAVADEPLQMAGDEPDEEEGPTSLRYPLDLVPFKPKADLLLVGKCHPGPRPVTRCQVAFSVGTMRKVLAIVGDRYWRGDGTTSEPAPFAEMDLVYERSFGGPGWLPNPVGRGFVEATRGSPPPYGPLPNVEDPRAPLTHPSQRPPSAGFGPLRRSWKPRCDKLGTYDAAWREQRWPWFPADFDLSHFNAAPADMQVPYLRGDEALRFENLHPTSPVFDGLLPGLRVRSLVRPAGGAAPREVPLAIDTLWVDVETQTLVLIWRGVTEIASRDADEEIEHLFVASEPLREPAAPREALARRLDLAVAPPAVEPPEVELPEVDAAAAAQRQAEFEQAIAEAEAKARAVMVDAGLDPDHLPEPTEAQKAAETARLAELGFPEPAEPPPPWTRERVAAAAKAGESMAGTDLSGLDLSELDLAGADLTGAQLAGAKLCGAKAPKAKLDGAMLEGADLTGAELGEASLVEADLTAAKLERASLLGATLEGAIAERAILRECRLAGAHAKGFGARDADFTAAVCAGADFTSANLTGSRLDRSDWRRAVLRDASLHGCHGEGVDASEADLTGLRASAGVVMTRGRFAGVRADRSNWSEAELSGSDLSRGSFQRANFSLARLDGAALVGADFKQAKLPRASLRAARAMRANLFQADLERANLSGADLTEASLYGAETWEAVLDGAVLARANVKGTKLAQKKA